ncbi:LysR family transcriptional regulator [Dickeya sp. NCPPB 3274]|uniref:LysR family transcriptional regulator n=1 Tax=Dickeya sp. NCPPB 3274 TaxID=568766 RepID=UPI00039D59F4|nr:LysR family transcriptional regulator [Dickeya sp. NCPPB 3274]
MTFKQLEALYWVAQLGGFQPAALKLHTTQSAISKRIQELESLLGIPLFDRNQRASRLTEKGEEMLILAKRILDMRASALEQISSPDIIERSIRIGVTELTAMTWLPRLVRLIQSHYPRVTLEPDVDMSINLREKLLTDHIDLMIVPDAFSEPQLVSQPVGKVDNVWMCKPGLLNDTDGPLRLHELGEHKLLMDKSGPGLIYHRWFKMVGFNPEHKLVSNSIVALLALTISGLGISYFPKNCLQSLVDMGMLVELNVTPILPPVTYVAIYKSDVRSELISSIIMLAQNCCDFNTILSGDLS